MIVDLNLHYKTRTTADKLQIFKSGVQTDLHQLGYVSKIFGPHIHWIRLTSPNGFSSAIYCRKAKKTILFWIEEWQQAETWIMYNNVKQKWLWGKCNKLSQTIFKTRSHLKKTIILIWCDWKDVRVSSYRQHHQFRCILQSSRQIECSNQPETSGIC